MTELQEAIDDLRKDMRNWFWGGLFIVLVAIIIFR
jgi:hypothetical protein